MRVWKIITDLTVEESENINEIFTIEDGDIVRDLDENCEIYSWDLIDGEIFIPFLLCTEQVIDIVSDLSHKYGIKFGPIDITEEFLMGLVEIPDSDFTRFREENLTEDIVFDKIKKYGGESLSELDKTILLNNC